MYHTSQQIWSNRYLNWETTVADDQSDAIGSQNLFDFSWFFACWWDVAFVWFSTHTFVQLSPFSCVGRKSSWFSAQGHFKSFWIFSMNAAFWVMPCTSCDKKYDFSIIVEFAICRIRLHDRKMWFNRKIDEK